MVVARWVKLQAGPIPLYLLNTKARVAAVRFHDIHHVVTAYNTTWTGEAEIGAWEIASGCAYHYAAWLLNLQAMARRSQDGHLPVWSLSWHQSSLSLPRWPQC
jgi:hypothetical protein